MMFWLHKGGPAHHHRCKHREWRNHEILELRTLSSAMPFYRWGDGSSGSLVDLPNRTQFISDRVGARTFPRPGLIVQNLFPQQHTIVTLLKLNFKKAQGTSLEQSEPMGWKPERRQTVTSWVQRYLVALHLWLSKLQNVGWEIFLNASQLSSVAKTDTNK